MRVLRLSLAVLVLVTATSLSAETLAERVEAQLRKTSSRRYQRALAILLDPSSPEQIHDEIRPLWRVVENHVQRRSESLAQLSGEDADNFYHIIRILFEARRGIGIAGVLRIVELIPRFEDVFAEMILSEDFETNAKVIDRILRRDRDGTYVQALSSLLPYLDPEDKTLVRAIPWIQKGIRPKNYESTRMAALAVVGLFERGHTRDQFAPLGTAFLKVIEHTWNYGNPKMSPNKVSWFARTAFAAALSNPPGGTLQSALQAIYSQRGPTTINLLNHAYWMSALGMASGREPTTPDPDVMVRTEIDDLLLAVIKVEDDKNEDRQEMHSRLAASMTELVLSLDSPDEQRSYLKLAMSKAYDLFFQEALVKTLAEMPGTEALQAYLSDCRTLLKDTES